MYVSTLHVPHQLLRCVLVLTLLNCSNCLPNSAAGQALSASFSSSASSSSLVHLTDSNFDFVTGINSIGGKGDWLILFHAPFSEASNRVLSILERLSSELEIRNEKIELDEIDDDSLPPWPFALYSSRTVRIAVVDITINIQTGKRFDIRGFPTLKYLIPSQNAIYPYLYDFTENTIKEYLQKKIISMTPLPIPPFPSFLESLKDAWQYFQNDLLLITLKKPHASAILFFLGLLIGSITSAISFFGCLRRHQKQRERENELWKKTILQNGMRQRQTPTSNSSSNAQAQTKKISKSQSAAAKPLAGDPPSNEPLDLSKK